MLEQIKACIFDMDGTLLDSMGMWGQIDIDFMADRNVPMPADLQKQIEGMSMSQTAVWFKETFGFTDTPEELCAIWNDMAREEYANKIPMKKGARDFLEHLKKAGVKMAIATSNSRELVEASFAMHDLDRYFDVCITCDEIVNGKPAPDVYLEAAKHLGLEPEDCLVFEDIIPGIQAGQAAGMKVCAVEDTYSKDIRDEKIALADYFIEDFTEVCV